MRLGSSGPILDQGGAGRCSAGEPRSSRAILVPMQATDVIFLG